MVEGSAYMFCKGKILVKTVTHEEISSEDLEVRLHSTKSGVTHLLMPMKLNASMD